jgi:hypothetical protein
MYSHTNYRVLSQLLFFLCVAVGSWCRSCTSVRWPRSTWSSWHAALASRAACYSMWGSWPTAMAGKGHGSKAPSILYCDVNWRWSSSCSGHFMPREKAPMTHCIEDLFWIWQGRERPQYLYPSCPAHSPSYHSVWIIIASFMKQNPKWLQKVPL